MPTLTHRRADRAHRPRAASAPALRNPWRSPRPRRSSRPTAKASPATACRESRCTRSTCAKAASNGKAKPKIVKRKGATCLVDARGGLAYEASAIAVKRGDRARAALRRRVLRRHQQPSLRRRGLSPRARSPKPVSSGFAFTNSPAAINAWGGKRAFYGTNPIAAIFPAARTRRPLVIDLSLTEVVRGKIMLYAKEGKPIPLGWAVDRDGQPTTDAQAALTGSLAAIGGMKGTMLALDRRAAVLRGHRRRVQLRERLVLRAGQQAAHRTRDARDRSRSARGQRRYFRAPRSDDRRACSRRKACGFRARGGTRRSSAAQSAGIEVPPPLLDELERS